MVQYLSSSNTKQIIVLNTCGIATSFLVQYTLPQVHDPYVTLDGGVVASPLFRIVEIPNTATDIVISLYVIDSAKKKQSLGQVTLKDAVNASYEIYKSGSKIAYHSVSLTTFSGAFAFYGINNSSKVIRARFIYTVGKEGKQYVSESIKKNDYFAYILPGNNSGNVQVKIEYLKDKDKDLWSNVYTNVLSKDTFPQQYCYDIQSSLIQTVKVNTMYCSKAKL